MSLHSERFTIDGIVKRLLENMESTMTSQQSSDSRITLRLQTGDIAANYITYLIDGSLGAKLAAGFETIRAGNGYRPALAQTRTALLAETTAGEITETIVMIGLTLCLATEAKLLTATVFESRDAVDAVMDEVRDAYADPVELAANFDDPASYQALLFLSGSLINHLNNVARPLPRMITFHVGVTLPALAASQRVYYVPDRWEELVAENHIIHPAFCLRDLRGLAA